MPAILENSAVAAGLEKVSFYSDLKEKQCKECSDYHTIALISHASKVMLKIIQDRPQQYMNHELPDSQAGFRKGRGIKYQITNIHWVIKKSRVSEQTNKLTSISASLTMPKPLTLDHNKLWKIVKEMGIPDHLTCS